MTTDPRDGHAARIVLEAVVDRPGVVTLYKVEQRDWQYRLLTRAQFSPLTSGGADVAHRTATELWVELINDRLRDLEGLE